jgi:chloramphenicol 3-O phosphotransferase
LPLRGTCCPPVSAALKSEGYEVLPNDSHILLLNGPSSSGKSSLAKEIQRRASNLYMHVMWDAFLGMLPQEGENSEQQARQEAVPLLRNCMHAAVMSMYRQGADVIWDNAMHPSRWQRVVDDFADSRIILIGVYCDVDELERRELARGNRAIGMARSQAQEMHEGINYDFRIDTTNASVAECAEIILEHLPCITASSAILTMKEKDRERF